MPGATVQVPVRGEYINCMKQIRVRRSVPTWRGWTSLNAWGSSDPTDFVQENENPVYSILRLRVLCLLLKKYMFNWFTIVLEFCAD